MDEPADGEVVVSVIVPVYQAADCLDECVDGIASQTHRRMEIILVDDGSTDGSAALCDAWAGRDPRVRVIHADNGGLSVARNRGLDVATGSFLTFVDADDVVSPRYVATLLRVARATGADLVMADLVAFSGTEAPAFRLGRHVRVEPGHAVLARIVSTGIGFASCGKLMSAEVFADLRFRPHSDFEDLELLPRLVAAAATVAVSDAAEYGYRQHPGSLMAGHRKLLRPSILHVLSSNIAYARDTEPDPGRRQDLVLGYVLHAMRTLEGSLPGTARRAAGYDAEYRRFMRAHVRMLLSSPHISALYKAAALVSVASPGLFVRGVRAAGRVKSTVAPSLRRRSGATTSRQY